MAWRALLILALLLASAPAKCETGNSFAAFLEELWADAAKQGITRATDKPRVAVARRDRLAEIGTMGRCIARCGR